MAASHIRLSNTWVRRRLKTLTHRQLVVYLVLLTYRDATTCECYPGITRLCEATGLSRSSVSLAINELADIGLIEIRRARWQTTARYANNVYTVKDPA